MNSLCLKKVINLWVLYPFQTDLLRTSHQTRVWGEQWMTFLGNPYANRRCGQYALSYRLPVSGVISACVTVATKTCLGYELDIRVIVYVENLVNDYFILEYLLFITIFYHCIQQMRIDTIGYLY